MEYPQCAAAETHSSIAAFLSRHPAEKKAGIGSPSPPLVSVDRYEGRRVLYADAEDPSFWHRLRIDGIKTILLARPDLESKQIATLELRQKEYTETIGATRRFGKESKSIESAGGDLSFNYYGEVGVGFAEHV